MDHWLRIVGEIGIPGAGLIALVRYVAATVEQAEAAQKPCIVLRSALRDPQDAVLEAGGLRGDLILEAVGGQAAMRNIGTGPAVNIFYVFEKVDDVGAAIRSEGSVPTLSPEQTVAAHVSHSIFPAHRIECAVTYESLSKRKYETRQSVNNLVLGEFRFRRLGSLLRLTGFIRDWRHRRKVRRLKPVV